MTSTSATLTGNNNPQGGHEMFERFTDRARRLIVLAREEALRLNHGYISTEHILLAIIHSNEDVAFQILRAFGIDQGVLNSRVEELVGPGNGSLVGHTPFTLAGKKVLELALRESLLLKHGYIGVEHFLLALIREKDGFAAQALREQKADFADLPRLRKEVLATIALLGTPRPAGQAPRGPA